MLTFMFVFIAMYFSGLMVFCSKRKHLLLTLLSLEIIGLSLYLYMFMYLSFFNYEIYMCMVYLTMMVCESSLGLSILVSLIRTYGNDYFYTFNVLW